jgi:MFS family permease
LLFPTLTTLLTALFLSVALFFTSGTIQYVAFLFMGISVTMFISAAAAVTQDVIHAGMRAISYAIAVVIQNLLGASMAPIVIGRIYDKTNISTALSILPFMLVIASVLFYLGSRHYEKDIEKVPDIALET